MVKLPNCQVEQQKKFFTHRVKKASYPQEKNSGWPQTSPPKDNGAAKCAEERMIRGTTGSNCVRSGQGPSRASEHLRIILQALGRAKIFLFFLMPRNKWRGCGRENGGEHVSKFKYRIKTN